MADDPVLVVESVSKRFGGVAALDDVDLVVQRGEVHGVVGPNGAGKSTLLAIISGLFPPDRGRVIWRGQDISRMAAWRRARLGIARSFQSAQVVGEMTVRENVTLGLYLDIHRGLLRDVFTPQHRRAAEAQHAVDATLGRFGLLPHADELCGNLAFGQQRLTELARCFVRKPDLLLLDEAAAGLDSTDKALLVAQVKALAAEGTTVCLIEHDTDLVSRSCDQVTVLDAGAVLARGTGREIFRHSDVRASYMGTRQRRQRPMSAPEAER
jgi:branched-chain amino acid transport system ATP-binding protein